jgi:hypothetical protein
VIRRLALVALVVGAAVAARRQLVHVLTRITGTWVGSPPRQPGG